MRISRWAVRYRGLGPATARADWRGGYTDGGDATCVAREPKPECRALPELCWGARSNLLCGPFVLVGDTLHFVDGERFVRLRRPPTAAAAHSG